MSLKNKKTILVYTGEKDIEDKVQVVFNHHNVHCFSVMLEAFDFIKDNYVDAIIFDTYQTEPFSGINEKDLDILLYYASSEDSQNNQAVFLPIDPLVEERNKAITVYKDLFEKYVYLLSAVTLQTLEEDSIVISSSMQKLTDIISALSGAFDELDEAIESRPQQEKETEVVKDNSAYFTEDPTSIVKGQVDEDDEVTTVTGVVGETEEFTRVGGKIEEDEETTTVSGNKEEKESDVTKVSGAEKVDDDISRVGGAEKVDETITRVGGAEKVDETIARVGGAEEVDETITRVGGAEEVDQTITRVSGSSLEEEDKSATTIKGEKEDIAQGSMKVKSITSDNGPLGVDSYQEKNINSRNKQGLTPVMVLAGKGQIERVLALLKMGANPDLLSLQGKSLLHYACRGTNDIDFIEELIENYGLKVNKRDSKGLDPLYEAIAGDNNLIIDYLVYKGARLETRHNGDGLLHVALKKNSLKSFRQLIIAGANLKSKNALGDDIIAFCKKKKHLKALKIIAEVNKSKNESAA